MQLGVEKVDLSQKIKPLLRSLTKLSLSKESVGSCEIDKNCKKR